MFRRARDEASAAIAELRDLARGIAPPILADRGLAAAVEALGRRSAIPVEVDGERRRAGAAGDRDRGVLRRRRGADERRQARAAGVGARCTLDLDDERLLVVIADDGPGGADPDGGGLTGLRHRVEALDGRLTVDEPGRRRDDDPGGAAMRVVIAEDQALLREGVIALLREYDIDVVAHAEDGAGLLRIVSGHKPDLAIVDVRLPPTFTDEGVRAAIEARARHPRPRRPDPVAVRRAGLHRRAARPPARAGSATCSRSASARSATFLDAVQRVAAGGTALDREVVAELVGARGPPARRRRSRRSRRASTRCSGSWPRAGPTRRSPRALVVTLGAVEKHISNIFAKLDLPATDDDHRRVLAVLAFLRAGGDADAPEPRRMDARRHHARPRDAGRPPRGRPRRRLGSGRAGRRAGRGARRRGGRPGRALRLLRRQHHGRRRRGLRLVPPRGDGRGRRHRARVRGPRQGDGRRGAREPVAVLRDRLRGFQGRRRPARRGGGRAPDAPPPVRRAGDGRRCGRRASSPSRRPVARRSSPGG